uniref:Uncharacterized protein n=1 Tax=Glossina austeni TaxID=7395 RepID=A0A1A9VAZ5_GLOAU
MSENIKCTNPENKIKRNLNLDILTFMQLDVMATWLTNETNELYREFLNKTQFVREQEVAISANETEMQKLLANIKRLEKISAEVTFEIKQWDHLLGKSCETVRYISRQSGGEQPLSNLKQMFKDYRLGNGERDKWLEMLLSTDFALSNLKDLSDDVRELQKCVELSSSPYKIIFQILDYQREVLCNTEKNLDLMLDKIEYVTELHSRLLKAIVKDEKPCLTVNEFM